MRFSKRLGMLLLGIYLILSGALPLLGVSLGRLDILLPLLAIAAGVLILLDR
jgi:hypothetical protein